MLKYLKKLGLPFLAAIPLAGNLVVFLMDAYIAYADDNVISYAEYVQLEQQFHSLVQGVTGIDMVLLVVVMAFILAKRKVR